MTALTQFSHHVSTAQCMRDRRNAPVLQQAASFSGTDPPAGGLCEALRAGAVRRMRGSATSGAASGRAQGMQPTVRTLPCVLQGMIFVPCGETGLCSNDCLLVGCTSCLSAGHVSLLHGAACVCRCLRPACPRTPASPFSGATLQATLSGHPSPQLGRNKGVLGAWGWGPATYAVRPRLAAPSCPCRRLPCCPPGYSYGANMFNLEEIKAGSPWGAATYAVRARRVVCARKERLFWYCTRCCTLPSVLSPALEPGCRPAGPAAGIPSSAAVGRSHLPELVVLIGADSARSCPALPPLRAPPASAGPPRWSWGTPGTRSARAHYTAALRVWSLMSSLVSSSELAAAGAALVVLPHACLPLLPAQGKYFAGIVKRLAQSK